MDSRYAPDRMNLSPEQMRALGYRVVDILVEHFAEIGERPVGSRGTRQSLEKRLREPPPEAPTPPEELLDTLEREVFGSMLHVDHPRFFAFVPGPGNFVSVMADALAAGFNVFAGTWFAGSGPAQIELVTVDWLRQICGLPAEAGGLFVSGGSVANLTALAVARHDRLEDRTEGAVMYCSDQTHSSVLRAFRVLGFAATQIRVLPCDAEQRLPLPELLRALADDRAAGRTPFCVVANAGTTNTGAVDPLPQLAALCRREEMWLHADGAYGAPAVLTGTGRALLAGLGEVDSLSLDPHKWLFQSFEAGCVLVRNRALLRDTFQILPEYLRDTEGGEEEVNFGNLGIQLTRSFRALKLWLSFKTFGIDAFRTAIARGMGLAELAEEILRAMPGWEIVTPARLGVVTFRFCPDGASESEADALNGAVVGDMLADGFALLASTVLRERTVLRLCPINPRTTEFDIRETLRRLGRFAERRAARSAG